MALVGWIVSGMEEIGLHSSVMLTYRLHIPVSMVAEQRVGYGIESVGLVQYYFPLMTVQQRVM